MRVLEEELGEGLESAQDTDRGDSRDASNALLGDGQLVGLVDLAGLGLEGVGGVIAGLGDDELLEKLLVLVRAWLRVGQGVALIQGPGDKVVLEDVLGGAGDGALDDLLAAELCLAGGRAARVGPR